MLFYCSIAVYFMRFFDENSCFGVQGCQPEIFCNAALIGRSARRVRQRRENVISSDRFEFDLKNGSAKFKRGLSSVGQSSALIRRWSRVQVPEAPLFIF